MRFAAIRCTQTQALLVHDKVCSDHGLSCRGLETCNVVAMDRRRKCVASSDTAKFCPQYEPQSHMKIENLSPAESKSCTN